MYLLADNANSEKKGALTATLPRILVFTDVDTRCIQEFMIDVNAAGEDSDDVTKAHVGSFSRLGAMRDSLIIFIMCQCTDSGGGGTMFALATAL